MAQGSDAFGLARPGQVGLNVSRLDESSQRQAIDVRSHFAGQLMRGLVMDLVQRISCEMIRGLLWQGDGVGQGAQGRCHE